MSLAVKQIPVAMEEKTKKQTHTATSICFLKNGKTFSKKKLFTKQCWGKSICRRQ
jgi:hypothetical protein